MFDSDIPGPMLLILQGARYRRAWRVVRRARRVRCWIAIVSCGMSRVSSRIGAKWLARAGDAPRYYIIPSAALTRTGSGPADWLRVVDGTCRIDTTNTSTGPVRGACERFNMEKPRASLSARRTTPHVTLGSSPSNLEPGARRQASASCSHSAGFASR